MGRVLIADDDVEVRSLLETVLRQRGLVVDLAADGREAIDRMEETDYAVVVVDLMMPNVDGFGVIEHLGTRESKPMPVVLVITGADAPVVGRLDARVIHGIIHKPFDPDDLANIVAACADIKNRSTLEAMAMAVLAGSPLISLLTRL